MPSNQSRKCPRELGFRMPAEWEPHEATWLSWPHNPDSWPGMIEKIPPIWAKMAALLHTGEHVHINVTDIEMRAEAVILLQKEKVDFSKIHFHLFPTNDAWVRDHGPIFITREGKGKKELALTNWEFNKWGGKYPPWDLDNQIPLKIAQELNLPVFLPGIVMEGGSLEVNGQGTCLTTTSCLLNKNRNPHLNRSQIEQILKDYLGVTHFLWLGEGIVGDDTDGHIDDLARFVNPTTVVTVLEEDPSDENYPILQENLKLLQSMQDEKGRPLQIVTLPMPRPIVYDGQRCPASYANFYIGNQVVLVPIFNDPADQKALQILQSFFPTRKVVGVPSRELIWGLGAFHCITQQQPAISF